MGDDKHRFTGHRCFHGLLNQFFRGRIQSARSFVKDQDFRVFEHGPGDGKSLPFASRKLDPAIAVICCGWTNRGASLGEGKLFFGALDGRLVALDEKTGKARSIRRVQEKLPDE